MSQLKPSFIVAIQDALQKSRFTSADFQIELPKSGRILVKITFIHRPDYSLSLLEGEKRESTTIKDSFSLGSRTETRAYTTYTAKAVPGKFKTEDGDELSTPGELLDYIPSWCENIRADLYALAPTVDPLEELRRKIEVDLEALIESPDEFFSPDELKTVDHRFDALAEELRSLRDQFSISKQQLDHIQKQLDEIKGSARVYPKGLWAKVTNNKLVKAVGGMVNSPEGRTFIFREIRRAIGGGDAS